MSFSQEPHIHRLGNGLTLLVKADSAHPVVSLQYWVATGSMNEGHLLGSGISHLLEHLVFKGSRKFSAQELAGNVQQLGGHWNAYTSLNRTVYYIDGPSTSWREFLDLLTELVFYPSFPADEFEREKDVIRREMAMYNDDADAVAQHLLMQTLYLKSPRRWPVLGELAAFNRLTRQDVLDYHACRYVPNNIFLAVAGNVNPQEIIDYIEPALAPLTPRPVHKDPLPHEPRQFGSRTARREFDTPYSKLSLAWRLPPMSHPDTPALSVLANILGQGRSALFYEKFHDELGIVHDIEVQANQTESEQGAFIINADVERDKRDPLKTLILQELALLPQHNFNTAIRRVCKQLKVSRLQRSGTAAGAASEMAAAWFGTRNCRLAQEYQQALERVTTEDIHRVCSTWLLSPCLTETSLDPLGSNPVTESIVPEQTTSSRSEHTLSNGLRVIIQQDHRIPMVHMCATFKAGCRTETALNAGISDLLAECLLKGTATRSASHIAECMENIGGSISSGAGNNSLSLNCRLLSEDFATGIELLADVLLHPSFPQVACAKEQASFIADSQEDLEDPLSLAFRTARSLAYGSQTYGNAPEGTPQSLAAITVQDLRNHYHRLICAQNAAICLSGAITPNIALPLLERHFADMPQGSPPDLAGTPPFQAGEQTRSLNKQQAALIIALPGIGVYSQELPYALLLQAWCNDMAGPLFTRIREQSGLAYYVGLSLLIGLDAGSMNFYLGAAPEQLATARLQLEQTLSHIHTTGMTQTDLDRAKASALSARTLTKQSNSSLCQLLALDCLFNLPADHFEQQTHLISNTTLTQINRFIRSALAPKQARVYSTVSPSTDNP